MTFLIVNDIHLLVEMTSNSNPDGDWKSSRRSYLKHLGAGALATTLGTSAVSAKTASKSMIKVNLFCTDDAYGAQEPAIAAVEDMASQLGTESDFILNGSLGIDSPTEPATYNDIFDFFTNNTEHMLCQGYINLLIYDYSLASGEDRSCGCDGTYSDEAKVGALTEPYRASNTPLAVVNGGITALDNTTFENMVKHECLHGLLGESNSPSGDDEHTFGDTWQGTFGEYYATPMITGYVESVSDNSLPSTTCGGGTPVTTDYHDGGISDCTKAEAERWLKYEY